MKTPFFQTVFSIVRKDLRAELRSRELIGGMALFALLSILIFSFALELNRIARQEVISGVLWVTIVFSSITGLNRSLAMERDQGNLEGMLIAPVDRAAIFFGKLIGNLVFVLVVAGVLLPVMSLLYNVALLQPWLLLIVILGVLGFCTVGTLLATMTVQTRARESLLPIIMLPITLPVIIGAVRACTSILNDLPLADWVAWPQILIVIDIIYLVMCFFLFEYVIEE